MRNLGSSSKESAGERLASALSFAVVKLNLLTIYFLNSRLGLSLAQEPSFYSLESLQVSERTRSLLRCGIHIGRSQPLTPHAYVP